MKGIYSHTPETNHFYTVCNVAAVLYLQFVLHVMLFRPWNMFCTFTLALSAVRVQCTIWLFFCISLISCFPDILLRYFSEGFRNVSCRPSYYRYHFCFHIPHALNFCYEIIYFKTFSASFLITFLSPRIAASINMHVPLLLSRIMMSGLLVGIVLSVRTCWFHNVVTLP